MIPHLKIGIDCGVKTGFAVWSSSTKKYVEVSCYTFWQSIERLGQYYEKAKEGKIDLVVYIEDVIANSPTFQAEYTYKSVVGEHKNKLAAACKCAERVGYVKEKTQLTIDWLEDRQIKTVRVKPTRNSMTKLNADAFKRITGYQERTNEHSRDAGLLCYDR